MEEVKRRRRQSVTEWLYSKENIFEMREALTNDFKDKGLTLVDYVKATNLNKSAIVTMLTQGVAPRPASLMAIDKYLKALAK